MSQALAVREPDRLEQLAAQIREGHRELHGLFERSLRKAIEIGEALIESQSLVDKGTFMDWAASECEIAEDMAYFYMRVAHYQHVLKPGINLKEARSYLRGLPPRDGRRAGRYAEYPDAIKQEAKRLRADGASYNAIAKQLQVATLTVQRWVGNYADPKEQRRRRRQREQLAARLEIYEKAAKETRRRGGSISKSFSLVRKLTQELDAARSEATDPEVRKNLSLALSKAYASETLLIRALGEEYGQYTRKPKPVSPTLKPPLRREQAEGS